MEQFKKIIEENLKKYFEEYRKNSSYSSIIWDSMEYTTLLDGAKRLRSIMALEIGRIFNCKIENLIPLSCAIEIMHAYSLIHDDLPCMDNDDLRRGKPTNHKVFTEAIATLAGDALISFGAQLIIEKTPKDDPVLILDVVNDYLICAGAKGIIAGQIADIEAENKKIDIENLKYIHKYKTGALFDFSITSAAKFCNVDNKTLLKLKEYSLNFGILFQIYDDIIDSTLSTQELGKTAGKDEKANKMTYVSAYGLEKSRNIFYSLVDKNYDILNSLNIKSEIFNKIYESLIKKVKK